MTQNRLDIALLSVALLGLLAGLFLMVMGQAALASVVWAGGVIPVLVTLAIEIVRSLAKGEVGLDIVAAL